MASVWRRFVASRSTTGSRCAQTRCVRAIAEDRAAGRLPIAVVATVGTTSSTSIDPVAAIAEVCSDAGVWLHVDAAYAGVMAIVPEYRYVLAGAEAADSLVVNPHKWLFTPFDLSALYCRRMDVLRRAFSLVPEYLRTTETAPVKNLMDTGVQLGRRFRALKLWMVLRYFGAEGIRARLSEHCRLARLFASWVDADPLFTRMADVPFSVVCFRCAPSGMVDEGCARSPQPAAAGCGERERRGVPLAYEAPRRNSCFASP